MPIHIKGSGGLIEAPEINVGSDGLITATASAKKTTLKLSSAHDADFIPGNIVKNKTIFGLTGDYMGVLFKTCVVKTGTQTQYITLPEDVTAGMNGIVAISVTSPDRNSGTPGFFTCGIYVAKHLSETIGGTVMRCYLRDGTYTSGSNMAVQMSEDEITLSKDENGACRFEIGQMYYSGTTFQLKTYADTDYTITVIGF